MPSEETLDAFRCCPTQIRVYWATREYDDRDDLENTTKRAVWLFKNNKLERAYQPWSRDWVRLPTKTFRSQLGAIQQREWRVWNAMWRWRGLQHIRLNTYEEFHFGSLPHTTFSCPFSGCNITFTEKGQWTQHAVEKLHGHVNTNEDSQLRLRQGTVWPSFKTVPEKYRASTFKDGSTSLGIGVPHMESERSSRKGV